MSFICYAPLRPGNYIERLAIIKEKAMSGSQADRQLAVKELIKIHADIMMFDALMALNAVQTQRKTSRIGRA